MILTTICSGFSISGCISVVSASFSSRVCTRSARGTLFCVPHRRRVDTCVLRLGGEEVCERLSRTLGCSLIDSCKFSILEARGRNGKMSHGINRQDADRTSMIQTEA
jgi:hypothetical protein